MSSEIGNNILNGLFDAVHQKRSKLCQLITPYLLKLEELVEAVVGFLPTHQWFEELLMRHVWFHDQYLFREIEEQAKKEERQLDQKDLKQYIQDVQIYQSNLVSAIRLSFNPLALMAFHGTFALSQFRNVTTNLHTGPRCTKVSCGHWYTALCISNLYPVCQRFACTLIPGCKCEDPVRPTPQQLAYHQHIEGLLERYVINARLTH